MKGIGVMVVGLLMVSLTLDSAQAGWFSKKKTEEETSAVQEETVQKAPAVKKTDKAADAALKQKKELVEKKSAELNNTEWQIELSPLAGKGKKEADVVTFSNKQVVAAQYLKKGFNATNYTLTVQEDGTVIWETMQNSDKAGTVFWRGEMDKAMQVMRGIVSYQVDEKTKHDYSFVSTARKAIPAAAK